MSGCRRGEGYIRDKIHPEGGQRRGGGDHEQKTTQQPSPPAMCLGRLSETGHCVPDLAQFRHDSASLFAEALLHADLVGAVATPLHSHVL